MKANAEKTLNEAKVLFQASLKEMLEPKEGWEEKPLKEISKYSIGLTYKPSDVNENGTIVLRSSNIQNDKLELGDIVRVSCPIKEALYVQKGDILMCSRNGSAKLVGKVAIIPETTERMTYGTFMMIIRGDYNPFLFYFFKSDDFRNQIKHGEANMINQITRYMLDDVVVNVPPLSEQQSIVTTLDSLKSKVDRLQENYEKISQECDALKQAILRQIFE
jgi:type I restriction enzyme S subunit